MVKVVNRFTKTEMWVADERLNEYLEAGHKLASESAKPIVEEEPTEEPKEEAPKVKRGRPKKK